MADAKKLYPVDVIQTLFEETTLATAGATTDSSLDLLSANSLILAVSSVVTEALVGRYAKGTITISGAPTADTTIAIGVEGWVWKASRSSAFEVTIGATPADSVTNLVSAINTDSVIVTAVDGDGDTVVVTSVAPGTAPNIWTFMTDGPNVTLDGSEQFGGTVAGTDADEWSVGDASTPARFAPANATVTLGTSQVGLAHWQGGISTDATGPVQTAAAKLRYTLPDIPSAGKIRTTVTFIPFSVPTS